MKIHFPFSANEFASEHPLVVRSAVDHSLVKYTPPRGLPMDVQFYHFVETTTKPYTSKELQKQGPSWSPERFDVITSIHVIQFTLGKHLYNNLTNGNVSPILASQA
jgi:hypothetical protein